MDNRNSVMKQSFHELKKKILSLTSSDLRCKGISQNKYLSKVHENNSVNHLPTKKRSILELLFGQRVTKTKNARQQTNKSAHVSKKVDFSLKQIQSRHSSEHIDGSKQSSKINEPNEKAIREHKCCSCSSCCAKINRAVRRKNRRTRGHRTPNIRRIDHVRSAICSPISNITPKIPKIEEKIAAKYFEGYYNTKKQPEKKLKVSEKHYVRAEKSKIVNKTSKVMCSTTVDNIKLRNILTLRDCNRRSFSYHYNIMLQRHPIKQSSFYTMNMQVQNNRKTRFKLKPYECEPGVCVPGQCNPIECEKLIRKRLMKRSSTMTSTDMRSQSISSETARSHTVSKTQGHEVKRSRAPKSKAVPERRGVQYQTMPRHETAPKHDKQAVRIGSSFSFNIEFSKNRTDNKIHSASSPRRKIGSVSSTSTSWDEKRLKAQGTPGHKIRNRNEGSQSNLRAYNKGSMMRLKHKRCFCTLELQRRELHHKGISINMKGIPPESITMMSSGQNTKTKKIHYGRRLEPYECEPNVCVPGECDPYKCLERIKKRSRSTKDFSSGKYASNASVSSMTSGINNKGKHAQYKQKIRENKKKLKFVPGQTSQSMFNAPVKSNINSSRQAVRISSNFGFNVEFIKDKSFDDQTFLDLNSTSKQKLRSRTANTITHQNKPQSSEKSIQDSKVSRNQNGQVQSRIKNKGTKATALLERCFCTVKLFSAKLKNIKDKKSPKRKPNASNTGTFSQTDKIKKIHPQNRNVLTLEPYECEPGICIPGQCDPYECEKLLRKRLITDSGTSTLKRNMQQKTTEANRAQKIKNRNLQSQRVKRYDSKLMETQPQQIVEKPRFPMIHPSNWQGVKIGSNVSFNVEFYKELKTPSTGVTLTGVNANTPNTGVRNHNVSAIYDMKNVSKKGTNTQSKFVHSDMQAGQLTESKASTTGKSLKRCFCTAKLHQTGIKKYNIQPITVGRIETIQKTPFQQYVTNKRCFCSKTISTTAKKKSLHRSIFTQSDSKKGKQQTKSPGVETCIETCAGCKYFRKRQKSKNNNIALVHADKHDISEKVEVIVPYAPRKFKKHNSKSSLPKVKQEYFSKSIPNNKGLDSNVFKIEKKPKIHSKKVTFDIDVNNKTGTLPRCLNIDCNRNAQTVHKNDVGKTTATANKKRLFNKNQLETYVPKSTGLTEVKIRGKRLKNDVCVPKDRNTSTIVTISGSYVACDITKKDAGYTSKKAAGDTASYINCKATCETCKNPLNDNKKYFTHLKRLSPTNKHVQACPCISSTSSKKCPCVHSTPKNTTKITMKIKKNKTLAKTMKSGKQCTCGSSICLKELKKEKKMRTKKNTIKPCTCGSKVCKREWIQKNHKTAKHKNKKQTKLLFAKLEEQKRNELKRRDLYEREDKKRLNKLLADNAKAKKNIKKSKYNDPALIGQSLCDLGKLSLAATSDLVRSTCRAIKNPITACENLKSAIANPSDCCARCRQAMHRTGVASTYKRMKYRFTLLKMVKSMKDSLESNLKTAYLMHMCDKNQNKKKKIAKQMAKEAEEERKRKKHLEINFNCSPFMNSLRKRPCLRVYHMCPWFYPHCLSLIIVWRQFTELILFLLAIIVWCPLILCLETFRMFVCCCLCTA